MTENTFLEYYKSRGYKFLPSDRVLVELNGNKRPAEISAPYELQGKKCYNGRCLDNDGKECFLDMPEELILPLAGALKVD